MWKFLKFLLKLSPFGRDAGPKTRAPLPDGGLNDDLVQFIPCLQDALAQFVDIPYLHSVNFLLHYASNCVVDQIQVIWWPHFWLYEIWSFILQKLHCLSCPMRRCTVLLKTEKLREFGNIR